jgi:beta-glucanase (GH16 family)
LAVQEALGGDTTQIETNYFGKGDTSTYDRATWPAVSDPQNTWHTYKISWQEDATTWYIDGAAVRTLNYADAKEGTRYPQTPMRIRIGIWAGGDPSNGEGTIEWAGGETNYAGAPYTMYVKNVDIVNANPAESYTWTDKTGSYQSIKKSGAAALSQSSASETSTASSSTTSSSTESKSATEASTTATTLATTTQTSTAVRTTAGSTTGSSSKASTTGSSAAAGSSSGSSTAGSGSGSGSGSSTTAGSGSSSSSSSSSAAAATTSPAFNGAASLAVGPLGLLAVLAAFIQL